MLHNFYYNLSILYIQDGEFDQALESLQKAVATSPEATVYYPYIVHFANCDTRKADIITYLQATYNVKICRQSKNIIKQIFLFPNNKNCNYKKQNTPCHKKPKPYFEII